MRRSLGLVILAVLFALTACAGPGSPKAVPGAGSGARSSPGETAQQRSPGDVVLPEVVDRLIAAAHLRPYQVTVTENGVVRFTMGVAPNGDCWADTGYDRFVHKGLLVVRLQKGKIDSLVWDSALPQLPYMHEMERGCPDRYAGLRVLLALREHMRVQSVHTNGETWEADVPYDMPLEMVPIASSTDVARAFEMDVRSLDDGELLPVRFAMAFKRGSENLEVVGMIRWGDPGFPEVPKVDGFGLARIRMGEDKDRDVEGPPHGTPYATHEKLSDGGEWAKDPAKPAEVRYDRNGKVVAVRRVRGQLINGLILGIATRADAERRFGKPASATDKELRYAYEGGYTLVLELKGDRVTAVQALAPGISSFLPPQ